MQRRWVFPSSCDPLAAGRLLRSLNVPAFLAELLVRRGHSDPEEADGFLHPKLRSLRAPELLPGMAAAVPMATAAVPIMA